MVDAAGLLRFATYDDGSLRRAEGIVGNLNRCSGDIGSVLPVAPAMHVKTMTEGRSQLNVVPRDIAAPGPARARNGMPVPVKPIVFNPREGLIERNSVPQPLILTVVNKVVVDQMAGSRKQADRRMPESG